MNLGKPRRRLTVADRPTIDLEAEFGSPTPADVAGSDAAVGQPSPAPIAADDEHEASNESLER